MRTVREIYAEYKIPQGLQLHQLRVAAVASYVCEYFGNTIDRETIIQAGLFHDMGNIIKSDITPMPELFAPEGVEYWQKVKSEFVQQYGDDEHHARDVIAEKIGMSPSAIALVRAGGFSKLDSIVSSPSEELKIFQYGDSRVGPHGVLPLEERFREARGRAEKIGRVSGLTTPSDRFEYLLEKATELERQLVSYAHFDPTEITDEAISSIVHELSDYAVE